ncbi:SRPBCC family protein [Arthrobacter sp. Soil763]|uniref:SRPBCC family protein n=1 Tax=Arthrobacter sp. Soil763 TaxID=1736402 RepID=UPI0006F280B6|nr:SRPBCC family protein [Arthrobacter sp. Soil763]KRE80296.1 polyketide cyclase [Arthrobacter sp. Soil763]
MTFSVSRRIAAPADVVWRLLTDTGQWPAWGSSIAGVQPAAGSARLALGSRGRVRTAVGVTLPYTVTGFDPGTYWSWSVAGIPATGHRVTPQPDGCLVTFTVPWWAPAYLPVCAVALRRIERLVAGPESSAGPGPVRE